MELLDAYGSKLKGSGSPKLGQVGGVSTLRQRHRGYPSHGLTPERLTTIFMDADRGNITRQAELYEEMEEKDAHLSAVLSTRKLAVAALGWELSSATEDEDDKQIAAWVRKSLKSINNWDDAMVDMLDALGKGFSVMELIWAIEGEHALVKELKWLSQKDVTFMLPDGSTSNEPKLLTDDEPTYGEPLMADKFVLHRYKGRSGQASRAGVLRPCAWMYLFKNYTLKDWLVFSERYAQPLRVGKFSPGASEDERKALKEAVFNLGADAAAVISDSTVIELLDSGGKASAAEIYEALAAYCDKAISKSVLGQTMTTEHSGGSYAAAKVHQTVRRDIIEADAKALARTINTQLVAPLVKFNFGEEASIPTLRFIHEESTDLETLARTLKLVSDMGIHIPESFVRQSFGIPEGISESKEEGQTNA